VLPCQSVSAFLDDTVDLLRRTPELLRVLLVGLPEGWTDTPDVAGGWRPRDVVGHLITAELDDWIPRAERILDHGTARPFDPFNRFAHVERDTEVGLDELVDRFADLRAASLSRLEELVDAADLDRPGLHPALGEVTMRDLIATWAVHDLDHVAQIFAGMAGSHDAEVGPWKANLGILLRRDDPAAVPS
jgi:DinB superfamily